MPSTILYDSIIKDLAACIPNESNLGFSTMFLWVDTHSVHNSALTAEHYENHREIWFGLRSNNTDLNNSIVIIMNK